MPKKAKMATTMTPSVMRPAEDCTKSAIAISMRVGSGSSAPNPSKNSAKRGITKMTMIATTAIETTIRIIG